ncbi:MAG: hypothetical protein QM666_11130 [Acinetobacter sp.]
MATTTIDGFTFGAPFDSEQIKALAQFHRKQLTEAIFHEGQHIGEIGITQRTKISAFTQQLDHQQQAEFFDIYNRELERLAVDDPIHPPHAEQGVSVFLIIVILAVIAIILYFAFVRHITS